MEVMTNLSKLPYLCTLEGVCDSSRKPTSKRRDAQPQNQSGLMEGGNAKAFYISAQIRPDATAVRSMIES